VAGQGAVQRGAVILAALAVLIWALVGQRAAVLEQQAAYGHAIIEHAWSLSELQIESKNLIVRLHGHVAGTVETADVQQVFDILWSRIAALDFADRADLEGLATIKSDYAALLEAFDPVIFGPDPIPRTSALALAERLDDLSARTRRLWSNEFNQNRTAFLGQLGGSIRSATADFEFLIGLVLMSGLSYLVFELALADRARQRERDLLAAANSASELKTSFLANMSHEVRTPLNGVIGAAELLRDTALTRDQIELVDTVTVSAEHLLGIVNQILDLTKIEAGRMELEIRPLTPAGVAQEVIAMFAKLAGDKGVGLRAVVGDTVPARVQGDALRLRQIIANLVSNAVKFTERGEVVLELQTLPSRTGEVCLGFTVRDTGIGIERSSLARVMEPFMQSDVSHSRRFGGTGLGLTISRQLVEIMGGSMSIDSAPGQGTTVAIRLPLRPCAGVAPLPDAAGPPAHGPAAPAPDARSAATRTAAPSPDSGATGAPGTVHPVRLLVAEDNATNQMLIRRMVGSSVASLVMAGDGRAAVEAWRKGGIDLIFMDIQMPEMSGVEATTLIRTEEREGGIPPIPIYSLSANALPHQLVQYVGVGMTGHLSKPFRKAELLDVIARHAPAESVPLRTAS
jgi:signal transduction histidine kinase